MRPGLLALVLCGCFGKPGEPLRSDAHQGDGSGSSDAARLDAAVDAANITDCSAVAFTGNPTVLLGTETYVSADPAVTGNLLEVFFTHDTSGNLTFKIWHATRASPVTTFSGQGPVAFAGTMSALDTDPAPSSDGATVAFLRDLGSGSTGYLATLGAAALPPSNGVWSVVAMPGLETSPMESLDLSPDAKTLYWVDPGNNLHISDWNASTQKFVDRAATFGTGYKHPAVSADGLEIFFNGSDGIYRLTRASTTDAFQGVGTKIVQSLLDPDLTPDGQTLVFAEGDQASYLTRTCPAQ